MPPFSCILLCSSDLMIITFSSLLDLPRSKRKTVRNKFQILRVKTNSPFLQSSSSTLCMRDGNPELMKICDAALHGDTCVRARSKPCMFHSENKTLFSSEFSREWTEFLTKRCEDYKTPLPFRLKKKFVSRSSQSKTITLQAR